jgi:hypothetical protein
MEPTRFSIASGFTSNAEHKWIVTVSGKAVENFWKSTGTEPGVIEHFFGFKSPERR